MSDTRRYDAWNAGDSYDAYMGRWSRLIAPQFIEWLAPKPDADWVEVGCGTGMLSAAIINAGRARSVVAVDPSEGFLSKAKSNISTPRTRFEQASADSLPMTDATADYAVSGLVLNFVPNRAQALSEMMRVLKDSGTAAFYVWDYPGGGVEFIRAFWKAATSLDPKAIELTEDRRFPYCTKSALVSLAQDAGFDNISATALEAPTRFRDFDDFWYPFTLGAGPAPGYCVSLEEDRRERLKETLRSSLPTDRDGSIALKVRAWAVQGSK